MSIATLERSAWRIDKAVLEASEPGIGDLRDFSPAERLEMVEDLRAQWYGWHDETLPGLQRVLVLSRR